LEECTFVNPVEVRTAVSTILSKILLMCLFQCVTNGNAYCANELIDEANILKWINSHHSVLFARKKIMGKCTFYDRYPRDMWYVRSGAKDVQPILERWQLIVDSKSVKVVVDRDIHILFVPQGLYAWQKKACWSSEQRCSIIFVDEYGAAITRGWVDSFLSRYGNVLGEMTTMLQENSPPVIPRVFWWN
jgi:hypothetical protein